MEQFKNSFETENTDPLESELRDFDLKGKAISQSIEDAEHLVEIEKDPARKKRMVDRLRTYTRRVVGIINLAALALSVNHIIVHGNKIEKVSEKGKIEYVHSDPETNEILNFMTGKEDLTHEQKEELLGTILQSAPKELIEGHDIDNMTLDEIDEKIFSAHGLGMKETYGEMWIDSAFAIPPGLQKDQYDMIWEILEETGSPKIRWGAQSEDSQAHYNPLTHTIYVTPTLLDDNRNFLENEYIAELSHSKQFSEKPISSYGKAIKSGFNMLGKFIAAGGQNSFKNIQKEEYSEVGSLEHEAHSEIEIALKEKYKNISHPE